MDCIGFNDKDSSKGIPSIGNLLLPIKKDRSS